MNNSINPQKKKVILYLLLFIMPICGFCIDIYTPSLPVITHLFDASYSSGKLTISIYIFGFGLGQLITGYLSDKIGRKKILIGSLFLFSIASLGITFSQSMTTFLMIRLIQGLAVSGQILNARAIVADLFDGDKLRKATIYLTTAWTVSPIIGPAIGGYLYTYFSWEAVFYFLSLYSIIALIATQFILPETHHGKNKDNLRGTIKNYKEIFTSKFFMQNVYGLVIGFSIINTFNVAGPFFIENELGYSALFYSHIALLIGLMCFIGSLINHVVMKLTSINNSLTISLLSSTFFSLAGLIVSIVYKQNLTVLLVAISFIIFSIGMSYPNYSANCSASFKHIAGTAAAIRGVITMIGSAIITGVISIIHVTTPSNFLTIYLILTALSILIFYKKTTP